MFDLKKFQIEEIEDFTNVSLSDYLAGYIIKFNANSNKFYVYLNDSVLDDDPFNFNFYVSHNTKEPTIEYIKKHAHTIVNTHCTSNQVRPLEDIINLRNKIVYSMRGIKNDTPENRAKSRRLEDKRQLLDWILGNDFAMLDDTHHMLIDINPKS